MSTVAATEESTSQAPSIGHRPIVRANALRSGQAAGKRSSQESRLIRAGIATYICALLLIAAFSVAFHFVTDNIVHRQEATARIVNISGRQRMLSQRIAWLALERADHAPFRSDAETQAQLAAAIGTMTASHETLLHEPGNLGLNNPAAAAIHSVYFDPPYSLDERMRDFLRHARIVAATPTHSLSAASPDVQALEEAAQAPLLNSLIAAVDAYQSTSERGIARLRKLLAVLTLLMLNILLLEAVFLYRPFFKRLERAHRDLTVLGRTDPLTGCLNRRAFTEEAHRVVAESRDFGQDLAALMIDIDRFKSINDRYGHPAGDRVINQIVSILLSNSRQEDVICRMGGEEFAILLRGNSMETAVIAADKLRRKIAESPVLLDGPDEVCVTVSVGVAKLDFLDSSIFQVLSRADQALYRAKVNGRNCVEVEWLEPASGTNAALPAVGHAEQQVPQLA